MGMWNGDMRTIPGCCQKLLAQMLHDSVEYVGGGERAACDWATAGMLLDRHQQLINIAVKQLAWTSWFEFRADFNMQVTVVDSGGFHEVCWHVFRRNFQHWARELPKDKYGTGRGFC